MVPRPQEFLRCGRSFGKIRQQIFVKDVPHLVLQIAEVLRSIPNEISRDRGILVRLACTPKPPRGPAGHDPTRLAIDTNSSSAGDAARKRASTKASMSSRRTWIRETSQRNFLIRPRSRHRLPLDAIVCVEANRSPKFISLPIFTNYGAPPLINPGVSNCGERYRGSDRGQWFNDSEQL
jgi:hypothetical protein